MSEQPLVHPLFVGRDNAVAFVGREWRIVREIARALRVRPRRVGRIALYDARELRDAIERHVVVEQPDETDGADDLESLRARLGKQRRRR